MDVPRAREAVAAEKRPRVAKLMKESREKSESLLMIFIKNPVFGKVKTRLAEEIGEEKALHIYRRLLKLTRDITQNMNCDLQLWYSDFKSNDDIWEEGDYQKKVQYGKDLGDRMKNAFKEAFNSGYKRTVIIGSDCAQLKEKYLEQAFHELGASDMVIGPSQDGGYYLLGMNFPALELFDDKNWSSDTVYDDTISQMKREGYSFSRLPVLNDIDTLRDLKKSGQRLEDYGH